MFKQHSVLFVSVFTLTNRHVVAGADKIAEGQDKDEER